MNIRWLTLNDASAWLALRVESLRDAPGVFSAAEADARAGGRPYAHARIGIAPRDGGVLGAFTPDGTLVGMGGWRREPNAKMAHKAFVWGMYVRPSARRRGVARAIMMRLIERVRALDDVAALHLSVTSDAPAARALYASLGFVQWGHEPDALRVAGRAIDEFHCALPVN